MRLRERLVPLAGLLVTAATACDVPDASARNRPVDTRATEGAKGSPGGSGLVGPEAVAAFEGLSTAERDRIKAARVFFGHQSVGMNVLEGAAALGFGFDQVGGAADYQRPRLGHAFIDSNGAPLQKMSSFEGFVSRLAGVELAAMKLCWVDFDGNTDVAKLQAAYVETVNRIVDTQPKLRLVHVTTPLKTGGPANNETRLAHGEWMKNTYRGKAVVLDLAAIQSTNPDGTACLSGGVRALCPRYASDDGHLNAEGRARAARALLVAISRAL
jgi:hypothetical protein